MRDLLKPADAIVANSPPWTLLRGVLEPASVALWVMASPERRTRRQRALRVWYDDFEQRRLWEQDVRWKPSYQGKTAEQRLATVLKVSRRLGIPDTQITTPLNYCQAVEHAGKAVGRKAQVARARWREASGFAHGRFWTMMRLSELRPTTATVDDVTMQSTLDENRLNELAVLTTQIVHGCMDRWSELADDGPDPS
jgi:hypothetical protein